MDYFFEILAICVLILVLTTGPVRRLAGWWYCRWFHRPVIHSRRAGKRWMKCSCGREWDG